MNMKLLVKTALGCSLLTIILWIGVSQQKTTYFISQLNLAIDLPSNYLPAEELSFKDDLAWGFSQSFAIEKKYRRFEKKAKISTSISFILPTEDEIDSSNQTNQALLDFSIEKVIDYVDLDSVYQSENKQMKHSCDILSHEFDGLYSVNTTSHSSSGLTGFIITVPETKVRAVIYSVLCDDTPHFYIIGGSPHIEEIEEIVRDMVESIQLKTRN